MSTDEGDIAADSEGRASVKSNASLVSLMHEPDRLNAEAASLNTELEALVMDNYRVFVENLTCYTHLKSQDKRLKVVSTELTSNLRDLSQQCFAFKDRVHQFVNAHKRNRKTLRHHMQLVELLEVPQLVDACARNGFHDEALELANFVNGLERRHLLASEVKSLNGKMRGGSGVVQSIVDDVHATLSGLRQQLLHTLTENTSLPKEIQILATLRKLDSLLIERFLSLARHENEVQNANSSETSSGVWTDKLQGGDQLRTRLVQSSEIRLQMDFLEARSIWLARHLDNSKAAAAGAAATTTDASTASGGRKDNALSKGTSQSSTALGPYGQAIELLELQRTALFAVITQFNSLFRQSDSHHSGQEGVVSPTYSSATSILSAWITRQIARLLDELRLLLPQVDEGASLRSVLEQSLFFASRMSQVGCDFSGMLLPVFRDVICVRFERDLRRYSNYFRQMMQNERVCFHFEDISSSLDAAGALQSSNNSTALSTGQAEQLIPLYSVQDLSNSGKDLTASLGSLSLTTAAAADELSAPQSLMKYPPLAYLLNALLGCLNFLRECPLLTVRDDILQILGTFVGEICSFLCEQKLTIRNLGKKYFGDGYMRENLSQKTIKGAEPKVSEKLDQHYARALANELFPHVLICFESIFNTTSNSFVNKVRKYRTQMAHKAASTSSSSSAGATYLISSPHEAKELLGPHLFSKLDLHCWSVLKDAGFVLHQLESAAPTGELLSSG